MAYLMKRFPGKREKYFFLFVLGFGFLLLLPAAQAALLIWPTSLSIEANEKATALWLENRGLTPQVYQARVFSWSQENGEDKLTEQETLIASPPLMQVEPGKRQLIRLIHRAQTQPGSEKTYRVIVDELPIKADDTPENTSSSIQFRMRYSIPLFVYGQGLSHPGQDADNKAERDEVVTSGSLSWRIVRNRQSSFLEIHNTGPIHVHLRDIQFEAEASGLKKDSLPTGYVLAGRFMQWPLKKNQPGSSNKKLTAILNGKQRIVIPYAE